MPDVTVIIPAYNARETIGETLDSLQLQTYRDFDIIVVDDGSTDGTAELVEAHSPSAQVIRQANGGPSAARNTGIAQASGKWIAFLDADDTWLPHRLEVQMWFASRYPEVILWAGQSVPMAYQGKVQEFDAEDTPQVSWIGLEDLAICNLLITTTVLVQREDVLGSGGFDPQFRGPEDYDLWIRLATQGKIGRIEFPLIRYRYVDGSLSNSVEHFLPEYRRVLQKNHQAGGPLAQFGALKTAIAVSYVQASIAAYQNDERLNALKFLIKSMLIYPRAIQYPKVKASYSRIKLLLRYLTSAH